MPAGRSAAEINAEEQRAKRDTINGNAQSQLDELNRMDGSGKYPSDGGGKPIAIPHKDQSMAEYLGSRIPIIRDLNKALKGSK